MPDAGLKRPVAVVSGLGPGLGTALSRRLCSEGFAVAGLARSKGYGLELERELEASGARFKFYTCDITDEQTVNNVLGRIAERWDAPSVLIHNAGQLLIKPFVEVTPEAFESMWRVTALGAMLSARAVIPSMLERGGGSIIFTGATAGIRGSAKFSAFASAKFALRGLAQSLAREYGPQGIHVVHAVLDGIMWGGISREMVKVPREDCIEPDSVAETYLQLIRQDRSAWSHEIDLRPSKETF